MKKSTTLVLAILLVIIAIVAAYFTQNSTKPITEITESAEIQPNQLWVTDHSPIIGPKDAPVTLVEFMDPACEACRAMYPYVKQIMKKYPNEVRLVIRYVAFHKESEEAIRILEAARKQDRFESVLEVMLAFQPVWAPHGRDGDDIWEFVAKVELDIDKAKQDAQDSATANVIALDMADFDASGAKKTPSFFINGKPLELMHPDPLIEMIEAEVQATK